MEKDAKEALQVTKEITVKFIEAGRVSPANFTEIFSSVYATVLEAVTRPNTAGASGNAPSRAETGPAAAEKNSADSGGRKR